MPQVQGVQEDQLMLQVQGVQEDLYPTDDSDRFNQPYPTNTKTNNKPYNKQTAINEIYYLKV